MKKMDDRQWMAKNFPSSLARDAADRVIDTMSLDEPMHAYIDRWIAAYIEAGGKTQLNFG